MAIWLTLWLWAIFTAPAVMGFAVMTYGWMKYAHFVTFIISVILFVLWGRRHRLSFRQGLVVGAIVGFGGTVATQYLLHLPPAVRAFVGTLRGVVPPSAAVTMLHLHVVYATILSALIAAVFYGAVGAIAAWWGARYARRSDPAPADSPPAP